jgi:site-specific DNA-methyltransferase (adenine-specific)
MPTPSRRVPKATPLPATAHGSIEIHFGDNLEVLSRLASGAFDLIYIDPPFNTGRRQKRHELAMTRDAAGDRTGFQGLRYRTQEIASRSFEDTFDDYLAFLEPRLLEARRLLAPEGSLFVHLDCREVHYAKVLLDAIFGRTAFQNEIIWAYDYGARTKSRWPAKHDNILWYAKNPKAYTFRYKDIDRIPYLAPGLVTPAKAARGKTPTDTWWQTIVSPTGKEKTGYPTQKPLAILNRIVRVHSNPGDLLLDFFAGSGTLGEAAARNGRRAVLVDDNPEALEVLRRRLAFARPIICGGRRTNSRARAGRGRSRGARGQRSRG